MEEECMHHLTRSKPITVIKRSISSAKLVAKIPFEQAQDEYQMKVCNNTRNIRKIINEQVTNLTSLLDGYFKTNRHH